MAVLDRDLPEAHAGSRPPTVAARIGIVDDHAAVTMGVAAMLAPHADLTLVAAATTVAELVDTCPDLDVVLLDLRLADRSSPLRNLAPLTSAGVTVLAYTSGDDAELIREAALAGVAGLVRKSDPLDVLVEALRGAARGDIVDSADWAAALESANTPSDARLTGRESQVLALYASGEKADRVARQLGITRETVLDHVRRIRAKYAAVSRPAHTKVDLYRRAVEDGLLAPPR